MAREPAIRLTVFLAGLALLATLEAMWPRRARTLRRGQRWPHNVGLVITGAVLQRVAAPAGLTTVAVVAGERGWGLLPRTGVSPVVAWGVSVLVLDVVIYGQHVLMHTVPSLWRLHRVHHADVDLDATTGVRFHPVEYLGSLGVKALAVIALGAPAGAVLAFEVLLNATSMFSHANLRLPLALDRVVRLIVVTPDMHRVHHSIDPRETNSNYGFNVPWWDRVFGTYRASPALAHEQMTIGVTQFRTAADQRIDRLLIQPFRPQDREPSEA